MPPRSFEPEETPTAWVPIGRAAMALAFVCLTGVIAVNFMPRMKEYRVVDVEARRLEAERAVLQMEKERLLSEPDPLASREYVELKARDQLGYYRPGEVVFQFLDEGAAVPVRTP
jgi:cell division protein FtsB